MFRRTSIRFPTLYTNNMDAVQGPNSPIPPQEPVAEVNTHIELLKSRHAGNASALLRSVLAFSDTVVPVEAGSQTMLASEACDSVWKPPAVAIAQLGDTPYVMIRINDPSSGFERPKAQL